MNRTGLAIVLAIAAVVGLTFAIRPDLDIAISRLFDPDQREFPLRFHPVLSWLRQESMWVVTALIAPAVVALAVKLVLPFTRMLMSGRAVVFLIATLIIGPGLIVNVTMKDYWPRSRPIDVPELGGSEKFVAWWDPRGVCPKNCSFVAGESAGAFWTLAPAALAPPPWRPLAYAAAVAFGVAVSALRIAFGGHFFTDTVFAGVLMFLIVWTGHGLIYRWRPTRLSDAAVERTLEHMTLPVCRTIAGIAGMVTRRNKRSGEV
ncbi:MAG TPA: phosphatase PAP2 family protein [Xanthobacteraceae bacterium]|nr:phosphatase PAP2 family protein [Xanthobacteraceae bacterium]